MTHCKLTNTEVLCYVLGQQGGTLHQIARTLSVEPDTILNADADAMRSLCRLAQMDRRKRELGLKVVGVSR